MLRIEKNVDLTRFTTFRIGSPVEFFAVIKSREDLEEAIAWSREKRKKITILGGGSNILISKKVKGLVLKNDIKGIEIAEKKGYALVEAMSGESWTGFVNRMVKLGLHGLENLFLIYGTVGAAPIQNIGAYGVELKDVFHDLKAVNLQTGRIKTFTLADCRFGYRDSVFKHRLKGKYFILSVTVRLSRRAELKTEYGSIREELGAQGIKKPEAADVVKAIQAIRNKKLPNPATLPNAGSFFKNLEISSSKFKKIQVLYPSIPSWPLKKGRVKVSSAWLIEQAGFKGKKFGPVGMYEKQALIMVNYGEAKARAALALSKKIKAAVKKKFGLDLEEEVGVI